jgi:hypothetical protein
MVLKRKIEVLWRKLCANDIIVEFVNWRGIGNQVFWMPFLNVKGSFYFNSLIKIVRDFVFSYLYLFSIHFIKTFLVARHTNKYMLRNRNTFRLKWFLY